MPNAPSGEDADDGEGRVETYPGVDAGEDTADRSVSNGSDGLEARRTGDGEEDAGYGPEPRSTPIEPGRPSIENALFVVLGAVAMIAVMVRLIAVVA